ncbi:sugar phosphate isomerase/epimerase family protein [Halalkalibacillus halophilus]|uniref:sugar phosphate isomerase/epimerase family protein n=1 Tax=Halalkalibacillus halophilus TaxID=392827 RepID=UPI0004104D61|nr:sugar phosphate isomerase/epimerase family protein [Halalkalibacillus halophilus]
MFDQLAINSNTYHGYSLEDAVKGASEAGFTKIEIAAVRDHTSHVSPRMSAEELSKVKTMLTNYDMTCIGISGHTNVMTEEGIDHLLENIDLTVDFDCKYIVTGTGDSHGDTDVIDDLSVLAKRLEPVLEKCEKLDKILVIETHGNNFGTGKSLMKLAQTLNDRVKINYDPGNVIMYGNELPYEDLEASVEYVEFVHLKDKLGAYNEWNFPAIGEGEMDFPKLFQTLEQANYKGPISVEIEFTPSGPKDLKEVNQAVKKSFDYLSVLLI